MIKSVLVKNAMGETLPITLREAMPGHGLLITNIEGLGPPKADIGYVSVSGLPGGIYSRSKIDTRNIVFTILFSQPSKERDIEDARRRTYKYFSIGSEITMLFELDNFNAMIKGYVESNEPVIFSDQEETQISVICTDPFFSIVKNIHQDGELAFDLFPRRPFFEFPWENPAIPVGGKTLIFSEIDYTIKNGELKLNLQSQTDLTTGLKAILDFKPDVVSTATFLNWIEYEDPKITIKTKGINGKETSTQIKLNPIHKKGKPIDSTARLELSTVKNNIYLKYIDKSPYGPTDHVPYAMDFAFGLVQIPPGPFELSIKLEPTTPYSLLDILDINIYYVPLVEGI